MQLDDKISIIEAIIFAYGEPIDVIKIAEVAQVEPEMVGKLIKLLNDKYESTNSSLKILKLNDSYQFTTRAEYAPYIKLTLETKRNAILSQAALEVLTIIAYNQPVTKSFVEQVRGVDSSSVVNSLVEKELLEEDGRLDLPGRPVSYKTTANFLRCFQLGSLEELPPLSNKDEQMTFDEIENNFENSKETVLCSEEITE
ncbi:MAG: SMC-Scp complex subunit ScpB [Clostridiales bacterium]|nr:SMC-Scp complex subunit ScpB [Clostridiales bacterium]